MNLEIQIQSLIISFVFGMLFSIFFNLFYKFLFARRKNVKLIINVVFVTINTVLYFYLLYIVNDGIIHSYFIIMLILGFLVGNRKAKCIRRHKLEI